MKAIGILILFVGAAFVAHTIDAAEELTASFQLKSAAGD